MSVLAAFDYFPVIVITFVVVWAVAYAKDQKNGNREYVLRERELRVKEGMLEINRARFPAAVAPSSSAPAPAPATQPGVAPAFSAAVPNAFEAMPLSPAAVVAPTWAASAQPAFAAAPEAAVAPSQEEVIPVGEVSDVVAESEFYVDISPECTCKLEVFRSFNYVRPTLLFSGSLVDRFEGPTGTFADLRADLTTWSDEEIQVHFRVQVAGWLEAALAGLLPDEEFSMLHMG